MPQWSEPENKMTAREALEKIMGSSEGESGVIELEGQEAVEMLGALFQQGEGTAASALPKELQDILSGAGLSIDKAAVVRMPKKRDMRNEKDREEFLEKFLGRKAEDDPDFLNCQREVVVDDLHAGTTSYSKMREDARETLAEADRGEVPPEQGGLALAVIWLIDQIIKGNQLLRDSERIVQAGQKLNRQAKKHLIEYRDHMITEHGVVPDGLGEEPNQ